MASPRTVPTIAQRITTAVRLCKADQCDSRDFDDCFENGDDELVVAGFVAAYKKDTALATAVMRNDRYIGIANWLATAERVANPLFAG